MKKKFRSISWSIWLSMLRIIIALIILAIIANLTIISNLNDEFVFEQLEEAEELKKLANETMIITEDYHNLWVANFVIDTTQKEPDLIIDDVTKTLYFKDKRSEDIIKEISNLIILDNKYSGKIKDSGRTHYFLASKIEHGKRTMVFLTSVRNKSIFKLEHIVLLLSLIVVSFFISRLTAKKIAKPIQELELFSEEISRRNWNATVEIKEHNEIGLLAHTLENMRDSLKVAEERDRHFLQSTSHDLKTPVMIIKGYAQAITDGIHIESDTSAAEVILAEANRLERRITQLLRLNTFGHSLEYSENRDIVRIDRILNNLISKFKVVKPDMKWETSIRESEIIGDSEALLVAFENIFENQIRYAKSTIKISMENSEITISNDGPGFDVKPMTLFDAYKKDKEGKFGLGLAIVKQVIEAHEGNITAYNTENGVEFKISL